MSFTSRADIMQRLAAGKGVILPIRSTGGVAVNGTANAADGFHYGQPQANNIGSAMPGTIVGFPLPPSPTAPVNLLNFIISSSVGNLRNVCLARIYKFGTQVLTATGDQFTHDAATFPVTRTRFGAATTAIPLIPFIQTTAVMATTAAVITLKTAAGGTGYKNQAGSNVVGTRTMTYPIATTVSGSCFFPPLEVGDSAVTDIVAIQTNTACATATAVVWGMEILCSLHLNYSILASGQDTLFSGLNASDLAPAVATSGTATSQLVLFQWGATTDVWMGFAWGVLNS